MQEKNWDLHYDIPWLINKPDAGHTYRRPASDLSKSKYTIRPPNYGQQAREYAKSLSRYQRMC